MSGTSAERLARLLALVPWLVAHDGVSLAECAEHFGVSDEQLDLDLWLLVVCGVPGYGPDQLVDIQFWDDGRIHVLDPQTLARPLRLSQEEALTLLVALRMLAQVPGVEDRGAVLSAAVKLEESTNVSGSGQRVAVQVSVDPVVRQAVDQALHEGREVTIRYASATKDEVTLRTIRPRRLFTTDGVSYLEAYCLLAEAVRTFRLDRVLEARVGEPVPTAPTVPTQSDVSAGAARAQRTALLAVEPGARWIVDVHGGREEPSASGESLTRVRLPLLSEDWLVRLVLSLRGAAVALEPVEVAAAVASAARAALAAYPDTVG